MARRSMAEDLDPTALAGELRRRIEEFDWDQGRRRIGFAVICGALCALGNIVLSVLLLLVTNLWVNAHWLVWLLPVLTILTTLLYDRLHLGDALRWPNVMSLKRYMGKDKKVPGALGPAMMCGTALSLLGGASVGPDAAAKHLGASIGDAVVGFFGLVDDEDEPGSANTFGAATGIAACFAALLCSPVGIFFYVLEHLRQDHVPIRHRPTMLLACVVAVAMADPFHLRIALPLVPLEALDLSLVPGLLVLVLAVAVIGVFFDRSIGFLDRHVRGNLKGRFTAVLIASAVLIALYTLVPGLSQWGGIGSWLIQPALAHGEAGWGFALKLLFTVFCLGFGICGGEVTVIFVIGTLLGSAIAASLGLSPLVLGAMGLVALFGCALKCPVSAVFVGCEFFGWPMIGLIAVVVGAAWGIRMVAEKILPPDPYAA